jgi:hypothetical protein
VALLGLVVVAVDLRPELDLLDLDPSLLLAGLFLPHPPLVLVLAVIHDPADGGVGLWGHLHEVQVRRVGPVERVLHGDDPDLLTVRPHQANLGCADTVVYTWVNGNSGSPPGKVRAVGSRA